MADTSNAVILERVEAVIKRQDKVIDKLDDMNGCMKSVQIEQAVQRNEINTLGDTQKELKKAGLRNDGIVGGVLLGVMAAKEAVSELMNH